jgi:hypothetical protein
MACAGEPFGQRAANAFARASDKKSTLRHDAFFKRQSGFARSVGVLA